MTDKKPSDKATKDTETEQPEQEFGGFGKKGNKMLEPTRFGDWEVKGRCSDF